MKIKNWSKLICNIYDKNNYVQHITHNTYKQSSKVIQFSQRAWRKSYIDMNPKLRTKT